MAVYLLLFLQFVSLSGQVILRAFIHIDIVSRGQTSVTLILTRGRILSDLSFLCNFKQIRGHGYASCQRSSADVMNCQEKESETS